jgi:hypothetical protein
MVEERTRFIQSMRRESSYYVTKEWLITRRRIIFGNKLYNFFFYNSWIFSEIYGYVALYSYRCRNPRIRTWGYIMLTAWHPLSTNVDTNVADKR